jgi:50S ribosomal protein L16 3-hydroxylase
VKHAFLGGLDAGAFLRRHWQKKPLLMRGAFPGFVDPLSTREVLRLAGSSDASARLVRRLGSRWLLEHGPFSLARIKQLPRRDWTLLVQDTNHFSERAALLLERFDFIPHARVDDLMVSYAVPGGSVGPHVDSYDVFLLQGRGRRRWRISRQKDSTFRPGLPLKILQRFKAEEEWVLEPGDMLYLPPGVAHYGIAETQCLTWSVGLRAPSDRELVGAFLDYLHDKLEPAGHYRDPGARPAKHAGEVPAELLGHTRRTLAAIRWKQADVAEFAGRFLSEPKAQASFEPPRPALSRAKFVARAAKSGLALDRRSRLLFSGRMFFINGEVARVPPGAVKAVRALADARTLEGPLRARAPFWDLAYAWYTQGFLHPRNGRPR